MTYYVAIDIGGMSIKHGILTQKGALVTSGAFVLSTQECGVEKLLKAVVSIVENYQRGYSLSGIALATAGVVDVASGKIIFGGQHFPGYSGTDWISYLGQRFNLPVTVENDVNALALGEYWQGAAQGKELVYVLAMGTGIGGALMHKGKLIHGASWSTGEVGCGHMGEKENWEDVASTKALVEQVAQAQGISPKALKGEDIFAQALKGDEECQAALDILIERWAEGIANICYIVNPQQIILGGAVTVQEEYLKPLLLARLKQRLAPPLYAATEITFSALENRGILLGALYNFLEKQG